MYRKAFILIYLISTTLCLSGCIGYRTDFKRKRFVIKPTITKGVEREFYDLVDTTKLYILSEVYSFYKKENLSDFKTYNLKFYKNGRVADFYSYDLSDIETLNPERADFGLYSYSNGKLRIKHYFDTAQGGLIGDVKYDFAKNGDTLILKTKDYIHKYIPLNLPAQFLVYSPDW